MTSQKEDLELEEKLADIQLGSHQCFIYERKEEQLSVIVSFMEIGLERNEKCLYVVDDRTREEIIDAFRKAGVEIDDLIESGQFEFLTKREAYLKDGYFDPDEMTDVLKNAEDEALRDAYNGLRATGEMTWYLTGLPGVEKLMEYEMKLNDFLKNSKTIALCQYNEGKFEPKTLMDVIYTHPRVIFHNSLHENPYYMPPDVFTARLKGEVSRKQYENVKKDIIERSDLRKKREKVEEKARSFARELTETLDAIKEATFVLDRDHHILLANERSSDLFGVPKGDIIGGKCYEVVHGSDNPIENCPMKTTLEKGKATEEELYDEELDKHFIIRTYPIMEDDGNIERIAHQMIDITEREEAEEREDFLHSLLRHDVRNKIQIIQGYHELVEDFDLPEEVEEYLSKARKSAEESMEIIEKVRSLRKAQEEQIEKVKINPVVREVIEGFESFAKDKGVKIEADCPGEDCKVLGGPLLNQVFSNIIENAIQHSGGSKIRVQGEASKEEVTCIIEDDGIGIPDKKKDKIFDRGYTTDDERGTGLGMFLVKTLLDIYGGNIEVKDSELGGARVDVNLVKA